MTLIEMAELVCERLNKTDAATVALAKKFIDRRYKLVYDSVLWRDSQVLMATSASANSFPFVPLQADQNTLHFGHRVDRVIALRRDPEAMLMAGDTSHVFQTDITLFERTGSPVNFVSLPPVATPPTSNDGTAVDIGGGTSFFEISSSSPLDVGMGVKIGSRLHGEYPNLTEGETVVLNGTSPVFSMSAYLVPVAQFSKPATVGRVTVGIVYQSPPFMSLESWETHRSYPRVRVLPTPTEETNFLALVKLRCLPLKDDQDTMLLSNCEDAVMTLATADLLERFRQYGKAQEKKREAMLELEKLRDLEKNQSAHITRIVPVVEPDAYEGNNFDSLI
jgi:hypothetical protein